MPTMKNQLSNIPRRAINFRTSPKRTMVDAITSETITPVRHFFNADSSSGFERSDSSEGFIIRLRRKAANESDGINHNGRYLILDGRDSIGSIKVDPHHHQ